MTKKEIICSLKAKKFLRGDNLTIECDSISAISNIDIVELYLFLSGVRHWVWKDLTGKILPRQKVSGIIFNCIRDFILWPFLYLKIQNKITINTTKPSFSLDSKKLLFLRTDHWFNIKSGGSVGHLSGVISGFRSIGFTVHIVSTDRLVNEVEDEHFIRIGPIYKVARNLPHMSEMLHSIDLFKFLEKEVTKCKYSFIYQRYSLGNFSGVLLSRKKKIPLVCEYNGSFPWMARQWEGGKLFHEKIINKIELLNLKAATLVVVVSRPMKDELIVRGIEAEKILVNPNGVDVHRYSPTIDGSPIRNKYGLQNKTVVGFIGTFGAWHGAEVLASAYGMFLKTYPQYKESTRLLMIGDGQMMQKVTKIIADYSIEKESILTGLIAQEDGPIHLAACDILVSPHIPNPDGTPFFGSPTKLFEYMSMGKPIIASCLDQIGEVLKHMETAWMVKPGDCEDLMRGIKMLIDNRQLGRTLGEAARIDVEDHYTWDHHTKRIVAKLKEINKSF